MAMFRIRRFGVLRTATVVAAMYLVFSLVIIVPVLLLVGIAGTGVAPSGVVTPGTGGGGASGVGLLGILALGLVIGVLYALGAWVFTAIACLVYNAAARFTGGIEVQVERVEYVPVPAATWGPPQVPPGSAPPPSPPAAPAPPPSSAG